MNKQLARAQRGFTLIELMIVVAIIAILSMFAVPAYQNYTTKAHATEMLNSMSAVKTGLAICLASNPASECTPGKHGVPTEQDFNTYTVVSSVSGGTATITSSVKASASKGTITGGQYVKLTAASSASGLVWNIGCSVSGAWCPSN
ncbi:pilin [Vibrio renipiscarius]|uniref:Fimbrial protein n=1 Tax=Vibrio renipiscarius TaxID=1461322 RepID=A0A0C2JKQ3_9VIBR|nr:prepilin-type N-terminal cleavage/methylation domain-containing protein [Vibrio renipiscarius]KII78544.1 hypothetical protein PL18_11895 [Vibrio renipiscarius]KII82182.1 hypothetical protein OJ16_00175 [Vibrio renipiscarius]